MAVLVPFKCNMSAIRVITKAPRGLGPRARLFRLLFKLGRLGGQLPRLVTLVDRPRAIWLQVHSTNLPGAPTSGSSSSDSNTSSALESGSPFPGSQGLGAGTAARVAAALSQRTLRGSLLAGIAAQGVARDGDGPPALGSAPPLVVRSTSPRRPPEAVAGAIDSLSPQVVSPPASPRDVREW
jgi:hypothetical protein